jgi:DNA-binding beta-propeller fold protein YncE
MALAADGTLLYIADTGSHAIRTLDLAAGRVTTLVGTGSQAGSYPPWPGGGTEVALSSPWDVVRDGSRLYVAMAGSHQIWVVDLETADADWYVGNGRESTLNGPRLDAELAQPSAVVVLSDGTVAFADSESSAIRYAAPGPDGVTGVLAGSDAHLFDFGDADGTGTAARLQHPLGLDVGDGYLWVADTYNSKIKRLDPDTFVIETIAGGDQGWSDGTGAEARFSEPGGVSYADGRLYVADTNNHAIRVIDLETGGVSTLVLFGIERFPPLAGAGPPQLDLGEIEVAAGAGQVVLDVRLPDGYKVNDLAPFAMEWSGDAVVVSDGDRAIVAPEFPLILEATLATGTITVDLTTYYCTEEEADLCFVDQVRLVADLVVAPQGLDRVTLTRTVPTPGL